MFCSLPLFMGTLCLPLIGVPYINVLIEKKKTVVWDIIFEITKQACLA